jgi:hypothetical protein
VLISQSTFTPCPTEFAERNAIGDLLPQPFLHSQWTQPFYRSPVQVGEVSKSSFVGDMVGTIHLLYKSPVPGAKGKDVKGEHHGHIDAKKYVLCWRRPQTCGR